MVQSPAWYVQGHEFNCQYQVKGFQQDGRAGNSKESRFGMLALEYNNWGRKEEEGGSPGPRKDLKGELETTRKVKRKQEKEVVNCIFSAAPGLWCERGGANRQTQ